jgi:hypothetical protein
VWAPVHIALSPQGDELSPRGSWGICALALPEGLTTDNHPIPPHRHHYTRGPQSMSENLIMSPIAFFNGHAYVYVRGGIENVVGRGRGRPV